VTETSPWSAQRYLIVDVEGNGAHPPDLVELAVVPLTDGIIGAALSWLVRPATPITWQARKVHGITNDEVANLSDFDAIRTTVRSHLAGEIVIVGHNVHVDLDVLRRKLGALVDYFGLAGGLPDGLRPHRAAYDALVTARLLVALATRVDGSPRSIAELHELASVTQAEPRVEPQPGLF
jgi:exodeoxyribonuclease X